jgi:anti-anti-sigma regulatory factor
MMSINVHESQETGEVVITLGKRFDLSVKAKFIAAYSKFEPSRNYRIDFRSVEVFDDSTRSMLLLLRRFTGVYPTITIEGCRHRCINSVRHFITVR